MPPPGEGAGAPNMPPLGGGAPYAAGAGAPNSPPLGAGAGEPKFPNPPGAGAAKV